MNIILFGPPGSGKGTQSEMLISAMGMKHISTGDLFRAHFKNETELGRKAKEYVDKGELVPDSITIGMVEDSIDSAKGSDFILDGFPRNTPQAEALDEMLAAKSLVIDKAIFLNVPIEILVRRLSGRRVAKGSGAVYHVDFKPPKTEGVCDVDGSELYQRKDDHEDVVGTRLKTYEENTKPLVDFYKSQGKYVEIDGNRDTQEVFENIKNAIV